MRKNIKQFVTITCSGCGIAFDKEKKEYDRQQRRGQSHFYCSMSCGASSNQLDELSPFRGIIKSAKHTCQQRGKDINITAQDIKELWEFQGGKCSYTGIPMLLAPTLSKKKWTPITVSLDRIDSNLGYLKGNLELVCLSVNLAKNGFTKDQMKKFIDAIRNPAKV
jgi:hypothetical protein